MTLRISALLASLLLGVTGCATQQVPQVVAASAVAAATPEPSDAPEYDLASLPKQQLDDEMVMRFLVGDVAAQRGNTALAAQAWVDLARRSKDPRVAQRAAQLAVASGQLALALEATTIWVAAAPQSIPARQLMVSLLLKGNRVAEAEVHIQAILAAKPQEVAPFFVQMHQLWDKDTDRKAVLQLTLRLTEPYLTMPEAHYARAVAYGSLLQSTQAQQELDAALKLRPQWDVAVLYKVQLLEGKDAVASQQILNDAIKANPMSSNLVLMQARMAADAGQYEQAGQYYDAVLLRDPNQVEALIGSGLIAMQMNDIAKAQKNLSRAVTLNPKGATYLAQYLGQLAEQQYQYQLALDWYAKVTGEKQAAVALRVPRLHAKLGQQAQADKALAALPQTSVQEQVDKAQVEAQVWRERKEIKRAVEALTKAIAKHPDQAELYYDRSLYLDLSGDVPAAEADLRHYLTLAPNSVNGLNALGYILANRTDRYAEADTLLSQAVAQQPDNPVLIDSMGWLRFKQGRLNDAAALLERAYKMMPDAEVAAHLAEVWWQQGQQEKAKQLLDNALKIQPDDEVALELKLRMGW
ncbi:tetratricopeptide repeat protein [Chitinibacter bivalviorum]|uniref:Tetratricopeptide repeat protein n=1 Tax=Chitinibacter bivalviorum TaxID=2739434 RepID=A0A7H9BJP9_9NEIS|nr:tetratricopeptide repeat protein [Chitinibacter bivalviorum]QLG88907.1 tetratricopeptide repeat protein [Chitinibacter bivalviorum]